MQQARLVATWEVVDQTTWRVIFDDISISLWGRKLFTQNFKDVSRIWDFTFLDNRLR